MKQLIARLRAEPAMVAAALNAAVGWGASLGFDLTSQQTASLYMLASLVLGVAVRQKVTPVA